MFNHANQLFKVSFRDGMSRVEAVKGKRRSEDQ